MYSLPPPSHRFLRLSVAPQCWGQQNMHGCDRFAQATQKLDQWLENKRKQDGGGVTEACVRRNVIERTRVCTSVSTMDVGESCSGYAYHNEKYRSLVGTGEDNMIHSTSNVLSKAISILERRCSQNSSKISSAQACMLT